MPYPFGTGDTLTAADLNDALDQRMLASGTSLSLASGAVLFGSSAGGFATDSSNIFYDDTNNRFGIRTNAPQAMLQIGETAATARAYNSYTNPTNGEWSYLGDWGKTTNVATYGTDKNGSGTTRNVQILIGGTQKLDYGITTASLWTASDNLNVKSSAAALSVYDTRSLGAGNGGAIFLQHFNASAAQTSYAGINAYATDGTAGAENGDLVFKTMRAGLLTEAGRFTGAGVLTFGGTTASFPALRRNSAVLESRLGDNSGYGSFSSAAHNIVSSTGATDGSSLNVDTATNGTAGKFGQSIPVYLLATSSGAGTILTADDGVTPLTEDDGVTPLYADDSSTTDVSPTIGFNLYNGASGLLFGKGSASGTNYGGSHTFDSSDGSHHLTASTATGNAAAAATTQNVFGVNRDGMITFGPGSDFLGAFPALIRNGQNIQVRLGDNSAPSNLGVSGLLINPSAVTVTVGDFDATDLLSIVGTHTTAPNPIGTDQLAYIYATLVSSRTGSQYGFWSYPTFSPAGASLGIAVGANFGMLIDGSVAINEALSLWVDSVYLDTYTGSNLQYAEGIYVAGPYSGTSTKYVEVWSGIFIDTTLNGNGLNSGSVYNQSLAINGGSAGAGAGGYIQNTAVNVIVSSGGGAGTTDNYGVAISGNGGAGGGTTTNWALYSESTANSWIQGALNVGLSTFNPNNATGPFLYITASFGVPTGVPALSSGNGNVAIQYDAVNKKIMVYDTLTNSWKGVVVA